MISEPSLASAGIATLILGQNADFVVGPALFAALLPVMGWGSIGVAFALVPGVNSHRVCNLIGVCLPRCLSPSASIGFDNTDAWVETLSA